MIVKSARPRHGKLEFSSKNFTVARTKCKTQFGGRRRSNILCAAIRERFRRTWRRKERGEEERKKEIKMVELIKLLSSGTTRIGDLKMVIYCNSAGRWHLIYNAT